MSWNFTAKQIAEMALRQIGAYHINASAARPKELKVALERMDLIMGQLSGETKIWWLVPETISIPLTSGQSRYEIEDILSTLAPDGFAFPINVNLLRNSREDINCRILRRDEWDEIPNKATAGTPNSVYFDRQLAMILNVYPVPNEVGLTLETTFQTFAKSVSSDKENDHGLLTAWQRWMVWQLSFDLGTGLVRPLPKDRTDTYKAEAKEAKADLLGFNARQMSQRPRRVAAWEF